MAVFATKGKAASLPEGEIDVAGWLGLAAAPSFALMAWVSAVGSPGMVVCGVASAFLPINDMALMYLLMSLFHLPPWLKLLSRRFATPPITIAKIEGD